MRLQGVEVQDFGASFSCIIMLYLTSNCPIPQSGNCLPVGRHVKTWVEDGNFGSMTFLDKTLGQVQLAVKVTRVPGKRRQYLL